MSAPPNTPVVPVLSYSYDTITVLCDRCGRRHVHPRKKGTRYWQQPGCALHLNPDDRARGYVFTLPEKRKHQP